MKTQANIEKIASRLSGDIGIVWYPFFQRRQKKLITSSEGEGSEKSKTGWKYGAGAGYLKKGQLALFLFNFFKDYCFYI